MGQSSSPTDRPHAKGERRGRVEECERKEGVGEGSSTLSQLSLTYMERGDNNKCLCVRALEAVQLFCSHNGPLPLQGQPGPGLSSAANITPASPKATFGLTLFVICVAEEEFISWSNDRNSQILSLSHYKHLHLALVLVRRTWHGHEKGPKNDGSAFSWAL